MARPETANRIREPLALTAGEPAGIGGEITLQAWLGRRDSGLGPFFVLDDPARLRRLSESCGWPVEGLRVKSTPVAQSSPRLPKTIACTLTAVPHSAGMPYLRR